jgi:hypothetical protein
MNALLRDRRLWLLSLTAALAVTLGFFTFSPDHSLRAVIYGGYWAMLLLTGLFGWMLVRLARASWPGLATARTWRRWPALLVAGCGALLLVQEGFGFKILMDEVMLLGTSMSFHFDRTALVAMRGHDIQGAFQLLGGQLDKRPLFDPFLLSVLHDFTGYRPENAFVLNAGLTFVLLGLAYHVGRRLTNPAGGALAVLLLTSLPLLAQNATGGGFELLNLVMILGTFALGLRYAERRDDDSLSALCLSAALLAQTRYESVLFLAPVAGLVLWTWVRDRAVRLTPVAIASPLFLLPYALQHGVFTVRTSAWELASKPGYERPFSPSYVPENLQHAFNFFFDPSGNQSNSLVLAVLGFLAVPFFALWALRVLQRARTEPPARLATVIFAAGFALHTALMLGYFWGKFDDPVIRRLSLPLNLALVLAVVVVTGELARRAGVWRAVILAVLAGLFTHSLPSMARHDYTLDYSAGRETGWRRQFIAAHPEKDYLVIDKDSIIWVTHQVSSTPVQQALEHKENIVFTFRNRIFSAVYAFQRFTVDERTGALTVDHDDDLGPDYQLEPVWERRFTPLRVSRISRVVAVKDGPTAPPPPAPPLADLTKDAREKIRRDYLDTFIRKLP